jgi:hypothetical protein
MLVRLCFALWAGCADGGKDLLQDMDVKTDTGAVLGLASLRRRLPRVCQKWQQSKANFSTRSWLLVRVLGDVLAEGNAVMAALRSFMRLLQSPTELLLLPWCHSTCCTALLLVAATRGLVWCR